MDLANITSTNNENMASKDKNKNFLKILKGSIISIICTLILLTIYATILSSTDIAESTMVPVVLVITGISILIGSSMSSISIQKRGILNGGLVGLIYVVFLYIASSILGIGFEININTIIMFTVGIIAGMIGGVIGVNMKMSR